jgi:hypothetical protein
VQIKPGGIYFYLGLIIGYRLWRHKSPVLLSVQSSDMFVMMHIRFS